MPADRDTILVEVVRSHRARLYAALLHGQQTHRRRVNDNVVRLLASLVVAALACVGCVGFVLVVDVMKNGLR